MNRTPALFSGAVVRSLKPIPLAVAALVLTGTGVLAGETDVPIPDWHAGRFFQTPGDPESGISAWNLLFFVVWVIAGTLGISLYLRAQIQKLPAHKSMLDISEIIFQTCK